MAFIHRETFEIVKNFSHINDNCLEIDDGIVPAIQILNRKGYFTNECCAGHLFNGLENKTRKCYVGFKKGILLPCLPPGFNTGRSDIVIDGMKMYINKYNKSDQYNIGVKKLDKMLAENPELQKEISIFIWRQWKKDIEFYAFLRENVEALEQLYKWALELPEFKDE